ncbi:MAG: carboxypeptidase regulatory-like domain-containing protein [Acidobacteria bacterium]|nr:carboxypeptidase regulatory-like domain-containing protein [Acidobacteriota bacterium]
MSLSRPHPVLFVSVLLSLICPYGWSQGTAGVISGTVVDETMIPGVTITITNVGTGLSRSLMTDESGRFRAPSLAVGNYTVQASLVGFQTVERSGITLTVGREAAADFTLKIGEVSEKVLVTAEAPLVDTAPGAWLLRKPGTKHLDRSRIRDV